jgi:hypothetical protein
MAQSATTVTPGNPTPPTNFMAGYANSGGPPSAAYASTVWNDPWHPGNTGTDWLANHPAYPSGVTNPTAPPYLDDGAATAATAFGAPASGAAHEGAGTESVNTVTYPSSIFLPAGALVTVGAGPNLTANTMPTPNASHPSSLFPATNPTLTSITPGSTVSGVGTTTLVCTGTGFTPASKIYVNGVLVPTTFTSATSIAATNPVTKKTSAGTWPVVVQTGPVVTAAQSWTFT